MMDVDEMFAIEEEVVVDPEESLKKSMRKLAKKKDKKRKWRRKKRERLRENEERTLNEEDKSVEHDKNNENFEAGVKTMEDTSSSAKLFEMNINFSNSESSLLQNWNSIKEILQACQSMEQNLNRQQAESDGVQKELENTKDEVQGIEASLEKGTEAQKLSDRNVEPLKYDKRTKAENDMGVRHDSQGSVIVEENLKPEKPNNSSDNTDNIEDGCLARENTDTKGLEADIQGTIDPKADNFEMDLKKEQIFEEQSNSRCENTEFKVDTMDLSLSDETQVVGSCRTDVEDTTTQETDLAIRVKKKSLEIDEQSYSSYLNTEIANPLMLTEAEPIIKQGPFVKEKCNTETQNVDVLNSNTIPCKSNDEKIEQSLNDIVCKSTPVEAMDQELSDLEGRRIEDQCELTEQNIDNNDFKSGDYESGNTREDSRDMLTICGIMEEVQRTESELKEAGILLGDLDSSNIYPFKPNSILQSNVMAMEFDEGSQDSVMFDRVRREMGVQAVTLHHKIMYGMEETRGGDGGGILKADDDGGHGGEEDVNYDTHGNFSDGIEFESNNGENIGSDSDAMEEDDSLTVGGDDSQGGFHENDESEDVVYDNVGDTCWDIDCTIGEKDDGSSDVGYEYDGNEGDYDNCDSTVAYIEEVVDKAEVGNGRFNDNGEKNSGQGIGDGDILGLGEVTDDYAEIQDDVRTCESTTHDDGTSISDKSNGDHYDGTPAAREKHIDDGDGSGESTSYDHDNGNSISKISDSGTRTVVLGNESNDGNDGDSTDDIDRVKRADDKCKEKNVDKKEEGICSIIKEDKNKEENKDKDEKDSDTKVKVETKDDTQSCDIVGIVKQENVEGKEEGELSSSSDEENLEECKDLGQDKKQQKAGLASKSDEKKLNRTFKSTATTSKKTEKDGVMKNEKRRHSISCTRESSELKGTSDRDYRRGQKFEKERRTSVTERGVNDEVRSSRRVESKVKTESSKASLSKARTCEKEDNNKPTKERRSSNTSKTKVETKEKSGNKKTLSKETESKKDSKRQSSSKERDKKNVIRKDSLQKAETKEKTGNKKTLSKETESKEDGKRQSSNASQKRDEKEVNRKDSLQKTETKEKTGNRKSLSKETENEGDSKTTEKSSQSKTKSKSKSEHDKHYNQNESEKKANNAGNDNSLAKNGKDSCRKQQKQTEKCKGLVDKTSREYQTRRKESEKHENRSSSESSSNTLLRNKEKESENKQKTQVKKSGYERKGSTGSDSSCKYFSDSSKHVKSKSQEIQGQQKDVKASMKDRTNGNDKSSYSEVRRSSRESVKTGIKTSSDKNSSEREPGKKDSTKTISKTKYKTDANGTTPGKKSELKKREDSAFKSQGSSSGERRQSFSNKGSSCKTEEREGKKGLTKETSLRKDIKTKEKVSGKNENVCYKSDNRSTDNGRGSSTRSDSSCRTANTAKKEGSTQQDSLKKNASEKVSLRKDEGSSSVERKQTSSKKGDSCKTGEREGKTGSIEKASLKQDTKTKEKVSCKNEDLFSKSKGKSTDKGKSSLENDNSSRTGRTVKKEGSIEKDSLKKNVRGNVTRDSDDAKSEPFKKEIISKKSSTKGKDERKIEKSTAKESSSKEAKPQKDKKLESENDDTCSRRRRRSVNTKSDSSEEFKTSKIHTTKNLESSKEKPCKPDEGNGRKNKIKQKDDGLKTSVSSIKTETLTPKKAVAKRKLTVQEYKSKNRPESKDTLKRKVNKTSESKSVNNKTDKSKQSEKSKSQKQICKSSEEKLLGKRKRENTPERPQKLRKTTKTDTTKESVKCVKTKEAKLPGNVVTVRILKVNRGKALVLKRRHVNQLFIRGDNVIMVAYDHIGASEIKL